MCRRGLCSAGGFRQYGCNMDGEERLRLEGGRGGGVLLTIDIIVPRAIMAYKLHTLRQQLHQLSIKRTCDRRAVVRAVDNLHIIIFTGSEFGEEVGARACGVFLQREDAAEVLPFRARVHDATDEEGGGFGGHGGVISEVGRGVVGCQEGQ